MLIYKEELPIDTLDIRKIALPFKNVADAKNAVLKVDLQYEQPVMWYQADADKKSFQSGETKEFLMLAIGTGHDWKDGLTKEEYIGTVLLWEGTLVLHYFLKEMKEEDNN